MAASSYGPALALLWRHEGGYVDHPHDPGGATNMGITRATLERWRGRPTTKRDVRGLTRDEAGRIYRARYWDKVGGDTMPAGLDLVTFDAAVNSGPSRGVRWTQLAVGARPDGAVGPQTLAMARTAMRTEPEITIREAVAVRRGFLRGLRHWPTFGRGWTRRLAETEAAALTLARAKPGADKAAGRTAAGGGAAAGGTEAARQAPDAVPVNAMPPDWLPWVLGALALAGLAWLAWQKRAALARRVGRVRDWLADLWAATSEPEPIIPAFRRIRAQARAAARTRLDDILSNGDLS